MSPACRDRSGIEIAGGAALVTGAGSGIGRVKAGFLLHRFGPIRLQQAVARKGLS